MNGGKRNRERVLLTNPSEQEEEEGQEEEEMHGAVVNLADVEKQHQFSRGVIFFKQLRKERGELHFSFVASLPQV